MSRTRVFSPEFQNEVPQRLKPAHRSPLDASLKARTTRADLSIFPQPVKARPFKAAPLNWFFEMIAGDCATKELTASRRRVSLSPCVSQQSLWKLCRPRRHRPAWPAQLPETLLG